MKTPENSEPLKELQDMSGGGSERQCEIPGDMPTSFHKRLVSGSVSRTAITADIVRQVMTESGHRCAACGAPSPLEIAHIVPWRKVHCHKAENLICLCANCHERADKERWGKKVLLIYKKNPKIIRSEREGDSTPVQVKMMIEMTFDNFDERTQRIWQHALAGFLEISPLAVRVVKIEEGSVKVTIEVPSEAARKIERFDIRDASIGADLISNVPRRQKWNRRRQSDLSIEEVAADLEVPGDIAEEIIARDFWQQVARFLEHYMVAAFASLSRRDQSILGRFYGLEGIGEYYPEFPSPEAENKALTRARLRLNKHLESLIEAELAGKREFDRPPYEAALRIVRGGKLKGLLAILSQTEDLG